jgi:hypothetical protein
MADRGRRMSRLLRSGREALALRGAPAARSDPQGGRRTPAGPEGRWISINQKWIAITTMRTRCLLKTASGFRRGAGRTAGGSGRGDRAAAQDHLSHLVCAQCCPNGPDFVP